MNQTAIAAMENVHTAGAVADMSQSMPTVPGWLIGPVVRMARAVNPIVLRAAGRSAIPIAVVFHSGRRSGRHYATPVIAFPTGNGFVITLPYGSGTNWCQNVLASGRGSIRWHGVDYWALRAAVVGPGEALPLLSSGLRRLMRLVRIRQFLIIHATPEARNQPIHQPKEHVSRLD